MSLYRVIVTAGVGPAPVRRFVKQLADRLETVCMERGLLVEEVIQRGTEDEPSSVEIRVLGPAPTTLADEEGTHALVARAPERGKSSRKRWFAGVAIHAVEAPSEASPRVLVNRNDLEITATTASGPGGQHVNKTATAVRVRHIPSGLTVRVSDERSQHQNLRKALARIEERLGDQSAEARKAEEATRRLGHYRFTRGAPVKTYRLGVNGELQGCR